MKKYKVFVDSNGKDSLWFHAGEKVENPLTNLTPQYTEQDKKKSCDEVNGNILSQLLGLRGMICAVESSLDSSSNHKMKIKEFIAEEHCYKYYTLYLATTEPQIEYIPTVRQVKPELQPDGNYWK